MLLVNSKLPKKVRIYEVGPRDGLQNEEQQISVEAKVNLVNELSLAGIQCIEVGSFVSPKWIPQMANSFEVFKKIERLPGITYSALTPNIKGFESALEVGATEVAVFAAASETFSQKNINCTIAESLERFQPLMAEAKMNNIKVRAYVSCVLGCPYQGDIKPDEVLRVSLQLLEMGCYEVSLGDTIGVGTPARVQQLLLHIAKNIPIENIAVHFHDTYGQALANILAALELGISTIDSSVAGLGGCPYAAGASGNVATEDVLYMLDGLGIDTGINLDKVINAGNKISSILGKTSGSKVALTRP
jgi:isopropylmalate/homocitrate/citramalate synthase